MRSFLESVYGPLGFWTGVRFLVDTGLILLLGYKAYRHIRGTRAVPLLNGLAVLAVAYILARIAGLRGIQYLLDKAFLAATVALPIIFQPELRRALEHIGRQFQVGSLAALGEEGEPDFFHQLEPVIKAAMKLRELRVGGLIVVERNTGLSEYISSGVPVDAVATPELIATLFAPHMPLHDGAVIVRGGRVTAAACWLPLSDADLPPSLGSRHRAALGITEQTDAIAIVVSGESGNISVAHDGRLIQQVMDVEQLKKTLEVLLPMKPRSKLPKVLRKVG